MLKEKIYKLAAAYRNEFIAVRRHLHTYPELSYQEFATSLFIQEQLKQQNIPFEVKATTGVVGLLHGKKSGNNRVIALRADMDALPIQEENEVSYKSKNTGVMHACGHDVHTAILLGAIKILHELKDEWDGTVKFIFQPGEEKNPGGASLMIRDGVLQNPTPQGIIGLHVHTELNTGQLSFREGCAMASADELHFTIKGKGGHAASPHTTVDTVLIAAQLVVNLQQIISRRCNPFSPSVLSFCTFQGGNTTNVIPSEVKLKGTFRAMNETWRVAAHELIRKQTISFVESMGAEVDLLIDKGYPMVNNHPLFTQSARTLAMQYVGAGNVSETELRMGAEDFGYYTQIIPSCFYRIGVKNENIIHGGHTPKFDVDENAIEVGVGVMAWLGANLTL